MVSNDGVPSHEFASFTVAAVLAIGPAVAAQKQADSAPPGPLTLSGSFGSEKPGPVESRAKPVTADNPIPRRTVFAPPTYPDAAALVEARVVVSLRVTVDESGYVAEVRRVGAPMLGAWRHPLLKDDSMPSVFEALVAASTDAVKLWRYDAPKEGPITFDVTIVFAPETEPRVVAQPIAGGAVVPPDRPAAIVPIDPIDVPPVQWAEGVPPLGALIGKIVVPPKKTRHVPPAYPQEAKDANAQGAVVIEARVEPDGCISHARVLRSVPGLDQAALDAVMQWEFEPVVIDGEGVTYLLTTTVVFTPN